MRHKGLQFAARIILAIVGLTFLNSAIEHLIGSAWLFEHYEENGIGGGNTWVIGLLQLFAAINLLVPQMQKIAASIICLVMTTAILSHFWRGETLFDAWQAIVILTACFVPIIILFRLKKGKQRNVIRN